MTPDWQRVKEVVASALELPAHERDTFLDERCGADPTLRAEVEQLLAAEATATDFLSTPAPIDLGLDAPHLQPGDEVGDYRVVRRIAEGGMGVVWEATQERPRRTVALKTLRPNVMSGEARRRFELEIETMGRLEHPVIARIYGAGSHRTRDGAVVPWFAMELVDGHDLILATRPLALRRRVELFARVCDGVVHAHQHGVIHRDLKPSNVLVGADGTPKILDFGIARVGRSADAPGTEAGRLIGTLSYMSPEQFRGDPAAIDVRSDVYSLGVVLYELVADRLPFELDPGAPFDAARTIAEVEPRPPSTHRRECRGDLDTIVMTALAKDRERRYQSAAELAGDLRRLLAHRSITARPPTPLYLFSRFARRHRGVVAGIAIAAVALVAGTIATGVGLLRASRAEREASAVNAFLDRMLASVDPEELGRDVSVRTVLDLSAHAIDTAFPESPRVRAALHATIGGSYATLGELAAAEHHLAAAARLFTEESGSDDPRTLAANNRHAEVLLHLGQLDAAATVLAATEDSARRTLGTRSEITLVARALGAMLRHSRGDLDAADVAYREAIDVMSSELGIEHPETLTAINNHAGVLLDAGRDAEAEVLFRRLVDGRRARFGDAHPRVLSAANNLAVALQNQARHAESERILREIARVGADVWGPTHPRTLTAKNNLGMAWLDLGREEDGLALLEETARERAQVLGPEHDDTLTSRHNVATALLQSGRAHDAEPVLRETLAVLDRLGRSQDPLAANIVHNLASALDEVGRDAEAEEWSKRALATFVTTLGPGHRRTLAARNNLAWLLRERGDLDGAVALFDENLQLAERNQPGSALNETYYRFNLGRCLLAMRRFEAAEECLLRVHAFVAAHLDLAPAARRKYVEPIVELYQVWGRDGERARFEAELRDG